MQILSIDKSHFLKGMSHSIETDGGFSPQSVGIEVDRRGDVLGLMYPGRTAEEASTNIADDVYASFLYKASGANASYYSIGDKGKIYKTDVISEAHTLKDTDTKTYDANSSVLVFNNDLFISSQTDIYRDDFTFTVKDNDWWTATKGKTALTTGVPHKLFEFSAVGMMITNGNKIASWDGTTAKDAAFSLPNGWIITDCLVDGAYIYICASYGSADYSINADTRIFVWDGISTYPLREIIVDVSVITVIVKAEAGYIFFAGLDMFFFDGYNYSWIRYIGKCPNFNQVKSTNGKIYFVSYLGVACYNTRLKFFTYPIKWSDANKVITCLNIGYTDFIDLWVNDLTSTVGKFYRCVSNNSLNIFYSVIQNAGNILIRNVELITNQGLPTNATYTLKILDETRASIKDITFNETGKIKIYKPAGDKLVSLFQIYLSFDHAACVPVKAIRIYYDPAERISNK